MGDKPEARIIAEANLELPLGQWPEHNRVHDRTLMGVLLKDWNCIRCWMQELKAKEIADNKPRKGSKRDHAKEALEDVKESMSGVLPACPKCSNEQITFGLPEWSAQSLETSDPNNIGVLQEYQCERCGTAFWLSTKKNLETKKAPIPKAEQEIEQLREFLNEHKEVWEGCSGSVVDVAIGVLSVFTAQRCELKAAEQQLQRIDSVLARRPALDKPTRWENIEKAITEASRADKLEAELARLKEPPSSVGMWVVDAEQPSATGWTIRPADGTSRGDLRATPVAVAYTREYADEIVARRNFRQRWFDTSNTIRKAIEECDEQIKQGRTWGLATTRDCIEKIRQALQGAK